MMTDLISKIMFEYDSFSRQGIQDLCSELPKKCIRWLGENHPDNRTRKIFYELTGVTIGEGAVINKNFVVSDDYESLLTIGNRVAISPNVTIICASGPNNSRLAENQYVIDKLQIKKPVIIEDDVWIGANVIILPGITVGHGSIIGAGSLVNRNVEPGIISIGVPAKFNKVL